MGLLTIVIVILVTILIVQTMKYQKQLKKVEELTEQIEHFMNYPEYVLKENILKENLSEGSFANLYNQVARLEKQLLYEQSNVKNREDGAAEFVENMAHQIMNAVTALQLQLYLAQEKDDSDKQHLIKSQEYAERIQWEVDRILKCGQLSKGKIHMIFEEVDVKAELKHCAENLRPPAEERKVSIIFETEGRLIFSGDAFWFSQALENIIKNAVEHSAPGSCVSIKAYSTRRTLIIRVEDQGDGIPKEQMAELFSRFHRGIRSKAGYGVGLAMTKDIVAAHHGKIFAGNKKDGGAWFEIEIPFLDGARTYE